VGKDASTWERKNLKPLFVSKRIRRFSGTKKLIVGVGAIGYCSASRESYFTTLLFLQGGDSLAQKPAARHCNLARDREAEEPV
jgi:hypothetical protein